MKQFARDIEQDEPIVTNTISALFKDGDNEQGYIQYTIIVYKEDAQYFESWLLNEAESVFYAQRQEVTPLRRHVGT